LIEEIKKSIGKMGFQRILDCFGGSCCEAKEDVKMREDWISSLER